MSFCMFSCGLLEGVSYNLPCFCLLLISFVQFLMCHYVYFCVQSLWCTLYARDIWLREGVWVFTGSFNVKQRYSSNRKSVDSSMESTRWHPFTLVKQMLLTPSLPRKSEHNKIARYSSVVEAHYILCPLLTTRCIHVSWKAGVFEAEFTKISKTQSTSPGNERVKSKLWQFKQRFDSLCVSKAEMVIVL